MFSLSVLIVAALAACRIPSVLAESETSKPVSFHQAGSRAMLSNGFVENRHVDVFNR
jgi:hypothetical protein